MASADVQIGPLPAHEVVNSFDDLPSLRSNQGGHVAQASTGWMLPTPRSIPIQEMRSRYERDGYIWVKNIIPRDDVLDMREHYFARLSSTGILASNIPPRAGIFNPTSDPLAHQGIGGSPEQEVAELLDGIHADPAYRRFLTHPALRSFVRQLMDWKQEVLVERAMLRHNCPGSLSTGVHYDKYFLRAGEAEFLTAWVPIGDCAPTGGGLVYLENSNQLGEDMEAEFMRKSEDMSPEERMDAFNAHMNKDGFLSHDADEFGRLHTQGKGRWLVGDYEAGDVVFHKPYMIHAATRNEDKERRIRLASDLRFYEKGVDLDRRWMKVWKHDDGL